jgi:alkanesulfonate monooxygenase SsuD/methylene tetrahydromethanopterin reductase-like flavin-dependent oxidoreductase (luciferase family)
VAIDIGRIGVWTHALDQQQIGPAKEAVGELEQLGYGAVWIPESVGREVMSSAALLLGGGERIVVATGIANLWARDAMSMAAGQKTILSAYPDRFLLGIGVSHKSAIEGLPGADLRQAAGHHARLPRRHGRGGVLRGAAAQRARAGAGRPRAEDARAGP